MGIAKKASFRTVAEIWSNPEDLRTLIFLISFLISAIDINSRLNLAFVFNPLSSHGSLCLSNLVAMLVKKSFIRPAAFEGSSREPFSFIRFIGWAELLFFGRILFSVRQNCLLSF